MHRASIAFGILSALSAFLSAAFVSFEMESEHWVLPTSFFGGQLLCVTIAFGYVLQSKEREFSKDVQTLRVIAFGATIPAAMAVRQYFAHWSGVTFAWMVCEIVILIAFVRPLNPWSIIKAKKDPPDTMK